MPAATDPRPTRSIRRLVAWVVPLAVALALTTSTAAQSPRPAPSGPLPSPSGSAPGGSAEPSVGPGPASPVPRSPGASPGGSPGASLPAVRQGTLPAAGGILEPGEYSDWSLGPTLTFRVPQGWAATPVDAGLGLALVWGGSPVPALLTFTEFEGLVFQDPCLATTEETLTIQVTPEALAAELAQSPHLVVSEPLETEVAGMPALRVEVATQQPMGCEPPATWIWATESGGGFVLEDGEQATFLLLTVGERVLVISWEAYLGADFEALTAAAGAIVETLEIDPSTDVPGASVSPGPSIVPTASSSPSPPASASPSLAVPSPAVPAVPSVSPSAAPSASPSA